MFDKNILTSHKFSLPVISVGNLNLGGVGKTPHIEYLVRLLQSDFKVATLSRGYKRKTKGFHLASKKSTAIDVGDEPLQYFKKFNQIKVAVDEKRVNGIQQLNTLFSDLNVVLLDDAYQHRYVKPGINILATSYDNLYTKDTVIPAGRLREWSSGSKRADIIIVTKCPQQMSASNKEKVRKNLLPNQNQELYFTYLKYGKTIPFTRACNQINIEIDSDSSILLVTSIANPLPLYEHIQKQHTNIKHIRYGDHHNFSIKDLNNITSHFNNLIGDNKLIITTEKDIMRLSLPSILEQVQKLPIYYIPIEICFHDNKQDFDDHILNYVKTNITK